MQTTTVGVGVLQACRQFLAELELPAGEQPDNYIALLDDALARVPNWSASLQPLYELADRTGQPIAGIDIEATGVNPQEDKIIELVIIRINPRQHGGIREESSTWLIDPNRPIPAESSAVHNWYDKDIVDAPFFEQVADVIAQTLAGCIVVGFNSNHYDVPLLMTELARAGQQWPAPGTLLLDASVIFRRKDRRRLSDAVKRYCYQDGETEHRAEADAYQALSVLAAQLEAYPELGAMTAQELDHYCNNEAERVDFSGKLAKNKAGQVVFTFGKNKDVPVLEQRSYANWMLGGDFPTDTKAALRELLK